MECLVTGTFCHHKHINRVLAEVVMYSWSICQSSIVDNIMLGDISTECCLIATTDPWPRGSVWHLQTADCRWIVNWMTFTLIWLACSKHQMVGMIQRKVNRKNSISCPSPIFECLEQGCCLRKVFGSPWGP